MADRSNWRSILGATMIVAGLVLAFATVAEGGPFLLAFAAFLLTLAGIALNLKVS